MLPLGFKYASNVKHTIHVWEREVFVCQHDAGQSQEREVKSAASAHQFLDGAPPDSDATDAPSGEIKLL
jgi:hypothetical protein